MEKEPQTGRTGATAFSTATAFSRVSEDVFGQQHPVVASDLVDCTNCGRAIVAGRFAPHLEKCLGKGRRGVRAASLRRPDADA